ncbi:hypothetical protein [Kitasatospora sp. NPDC058190]|uniref:hypothetical protein n=1 Tax=Kitasatospora sp. NPDC058190 TaxID=3346371 RepID=UPI0036DEA47C
MTSETGPEALGLCVVANVARETGHGDGGTEIRTGLRHFAPVAKVWVGPLRWDNGSPSVPVVGRHQGNSRRYVSIVVPRRHLENFRVRTVCSPALLKALGGGPLWEAERAESYVRCWDTPRLETQIEVGGEDYTRWAPPVTDPPPMELEFEGATYHLAHFNANRARYSPLPPPAEPSPPPIGPADA